MSLFQLRQINVQFPPAAGATYAICRQGATVRAPLSIPSSSTQNILVFDTGRTQIGDTLVSSLNSGVLFYVNDLSPDRLWLNVGTSDYPVVLQPGARLVPTSPAPTLYADAAGTTALPSNVLTLDPQGRATFYYIGPLYDGILSSGGQLQYLIDQGGGIDTRLVTQVSVLDYPSFQAAHDALPAAGGLIFVPAGTYSKDTYPAFRGLVVTKPVAIIGVANGQARGLSVLLHDDPNGLNTDSIFLNVYGGCLLQNLYIRRPSAQVGTGRGVRWYKAGLPVAPMVGLTLDNVTVENSPNWSFEFACDGYVDANTSSYVSKLVMIDCTAFHAASGGSLYLGGAGSNNNFFTRCEFDGPGFGYFFNVNNCVVNLGAPLVTLAGGSGLSAVAQDDEVAGNGIAVGTKVQTPGASQIMLTQPAISTPPEGPTQLTFWRATAPASPTVSMPRGHVHLMRTTASRFSQCAFQGPGTTPALSTDLVSNDLALRDCYREREGDNNQTPLAHSFLINGMDNFLIDGLYHQFHGVQSLLLRTGPSGLRMGRITNAQLFTTVPTGAQVVSLSNAIDELAVDNSSEQNLNTGAARGIVVSGAGAVVQPVIWDHQFSLSLPNGSDEVFLVVGDGAIGTIQALRPKQVVTLVFTGTVGMQNGQNLRLNGNLAGSPNSTITLVCDGANWIETCRSIKS